LDVLFSDWIVKSLTATSSIRQYDKDSHTIPTTMSNAVFDAEVEPVERSLGLGCWRRMRNRNKFRNLFASGIVLGMLYDVQSKQAHDRGLPPPMRRPKKSISRSIAVEFEGKSYSATYSVDSKVVNVECPYGSRSTQVGGSTAEAVARMLVRET
jgi:hypothetical protein